MFKIPLYMTRAIELIDIISWHNDMPSNGEIVQLFDLMKKFTSDTTLCLGECLYRDNNTNEPIPFDYCRDIHRALKDYYLDHPVDIDIDLKWNIIFKSLVEPFLCDISTQYSHDQFLTMCDEIIETVQREVMKQRLDQPTSEEIKQSYIELVSITKQRQLAAFSTVINKL